jgi:hypothetical protein
MDVVISDFESVQTNDGHSLVHTISLVPATFNHRKGKMKQYTLHYSKGVIINISNVIRSDTFQLLSGSHMKRKHSNDILSASKYGIKQTLHMEFYDAIRYMITFIIDNGGTLISHCLENDLGFLVSTQNFLKGSRIVKNKLVAFPDTGMYDARWASLCKVCSMSLLCNRCPKFNSGYRRWCQSNPESITRSNNCSSKLKYYIRYVKNDPKYEQTHSALQDVIDLFEVIKYAYQTDGSILDKYSYLSSPNWIKAC